MVNVSKAEITFFLFQICLFTVSFIYFPTYLLIDFFLSFLGNIPGGWAAVKEELSTKYQQGGYPDMAAMIKI